LHNVGRGHDKIMARRKRHSPEQIVRKLVAPIGFGRGTDTAAVSREPESARRPTTAGAISFGSLKVEDAYRLACADYLHWLALATEVAAFGPQRWLHLKILALAPFREFSHARQRGRQLLPAMDLGGHAEFVERA
jgi:hypothetical protein